MHRRQPLPRLWLMTDERQGDGLWRALDRLPRGAGVVFRHKSTPEAERRELFDRVRRAAVRRRLVLMLADHPEIALAWGADGVHGRDRTPLPLLHSAPAHDVAELRAAERAGAHLVFLSPAFATRSHPSVRPLGPARFALLARQTHLPVIALGGMDAARARRLGRIHGWAGIDAWTEAGRSA